MQRIADLDDTDPDEVDVREDVGRVTGSRAALPTRPAPERPALPAPADVAAPGTDGVPGPTPGGRRRRRADPARTASPAPSSGSTYALSWGLDPTSTSGRLRALGASAPTDVLPPFGGAPSAPGPGRRRLPQPVPAPTAQPVPAPTAQPVPAPTAQATAEQVATAEPRSGRRRAPEAPGRPAEVSDAWTLPIPTTTTAASEVVESVTRHARHAAPVPPNVPSDPATRPSGIALPARPPRTEESATEAFPMAVPALLRSRAPTTGRHRLPD